ncbi:macrophage mannose receptor 1-like isoform X1 [Patagioenas fasciata]|uniref:macrophage mannose receptor 1-like isoform X1 n=1 Tax=Patagioenas fasciata TaxID=372321 RepID=UPI0032E8A79A
MYGNLEDTQGQGQAWPQGPGGTEACGDTSPPDENPYEPLDPPVTVPNLKCVPDPPAPRTPVSPRHVRCSRSWLLLVTLVALGVSVLLNVTVLVGGLRHVAALTAALEAEKAKEPPSAASSSFQLYNEAQSVCVEASGQLLTASPCRPQAPSQRFRWLPGGRLQSWGTQRCVTATRSQNLALVRLEPCRDPAAPLQRWECRAGGLLALAGNELFFNYGNNRQSVVMLYAGDREWSRWVVHGTKDDVCSRACCPPCSKGWTYFQNSCYFYSKMANSWENAQNFCSLLGSQLLEVDGPEEKDHIRKMLEGSSWLGIRDSEVEGTWKRTNGTVVTPESSWWHRNEPNGGQQENCGAVGGDGEWFDYPCGGHLPWVCEGPP